MARNKKNSIHQQDEGMTVHEKFALLTGHEEPIYIEALKMLLAELQENNPDIDYGWCVAKYKGIIEWLQSDSNIEEGIIHENHRSAGQ